MKYLLLISLLSLVGIAGSAQYDPDPGDSSWIKIRSIAYNHAIDEWVRRGSDAAKAFASQLPHDTLVVYVDSFKQKIFSAFAAMDRYKKQQETALTPGLGGGNDIIFKSGMIFSVYEDFGEIRLHKGKRRKKKKIPKPKEETEAYAVTKQACQLDTLRGLLIFNDKRPTREYGNTSDSGTWVGCDPQTIAMDHVLILPGYYFKTVEYMDGHVEFTKEKNGKFYNSDGDLIGNYRVYGLKLLQ